MGYFIFKINSSYLRYTGIFMPNLLTLAFILPEICVFILYFPCTIYSISYVDLSRTNQSVYRKKEVQSNRTNWGSQKAERGRFTLNFPLISQCFGGFSSWSQSVLAIYLEIYGTHTQRPGPRLRLRLGRRFLWAPGKKSEGSKAGDKARNCEIKFAVIAQPWRIGYTVTV